jgi:GT2 family glycosyltransferase
MPPPEVNAMPPPQLSIIIVNWNTRELTVNCLRSVFASSDGLSLDVILIDNASSDDSVEAVRREFPQVKLICNPRNIGFAGANNIGMEQACGESLLLLNSDTVVPPGALGAAYAYLQSHPDVGLCGIKLLNPDRSFQASYAHFPSLAGELLSATGLGARLVSPYYPSPRPVDGEAAQEVDWVAGAFMLVRRATYDRVGGMDTGYFMYSEETDWCYRIKRAGWSIRYLPEVSIIHIGGASTRQRSAEMTAELNKSKIRFFEKHYGAARARRLRAGLSAVYWARESVSRVMAAVAPVDKKARWQSKQAVARAVRMVCSDRSTRVAANHG